MKAVIYARYSSDSQREECCAGYFQKTAGRIQRFPYSG